MAIRAPYISRQFDSLASKRRRVKRLPHHTNDVRRERIVGSDSRTRGAVPGDVGIAAESVPASGIRACFLPRERRSGSESTTAAGTKSRRCSRSRRASGLDSLAGTRRDVEPTASVPIGATAGTADDERPSQRSHSPHPWNASPRRCRDRRLVRLRVKACRGRGRRFRRLGAIRRGTSPTRYGIRALTQQEDRRSSQRPRTPSAADAAIRVPLVMGLCPGGRIAYTARSETEGTKWRTPKLRFSPAAASGACRT